MEEFKASDNNKVNMFVCGSTVYDDAHLGHAKTYIDFDAIARWLRHLGYALTYVQNITDVDDKIIARARESGEDPFELARRYEHRLLEDLEVIRAKDSVDKFPRSHDYMESIEMQIQLLAEKGYAYVANGNVYYDVDRFKDYARLSGMKIEELKRHRIEADEEKRHIYDFALWKAAKAGEPSWTINLVYNGKREKLSGRPGWHIEDTAITYALFGKQYDIHGGAIELLFPHHSNEIAQAEAAFGVRPYVRYWLHSGVLNIRGEKMSKSLNNFITVREALKKHSAEAIRLMMLSTHYRKEIEYSEGLMHEAEKKLAYLYSSLGVFYNARESEAKKNDAHEAADAFEKEFCDAMNRDFDTPLAIGRLVAFVARLRKIAEEGDADQEGKRYAVEKALGLAKIIGVLGEDTYKRKVPDDALRLISEREAFRNAGNFRDADRIRLALSERYGIAVEDADYGTVWYYKSA